MEISELQAAETILLKRGKICRCGKVNENYEKMQIFIGVKETKERELLQQKKRKGKKRV